MADNATLYRPLRDKVASYNSICLTCVAAAICSEAKAELPEKDEVHVCNSSYLAERGCFS
jgi:hypothetical protein